MAVLPTPGSPISTGLFLVRRCRIWIVRRISSSRPITGSSLPCCARSVRSIVYFLSASRCDSASAESTEVPAAHVVDGRHQRGLRETSFLRRSARLALVVGDGDEEHLAGDEIVAALLRLAVRDVEQPREVAPHLDLAVRALDLRQARDRLVERRRQPLDVDAGTLQQRTRRAVLLREQCVEHVDRLDELVVAPDRDALGIGQRFLELGGEFVDSHGKISGKQSCTEVGRRTLLSRQPRPPARPASRNRSGRPHVRKQRRFGLPLLRSF